MKESSNLFISGVNPEKKRKAVYVLQCKGKTLKDMVNEQLEKLAKEFDQKNSK